MQQDRSLELTRAEKTSGSARVVGASFGSSANAAFVWRVILSNLPFAIALTLGGQLPGPLQPLLVGAIMFVAPGLAWTDHRVGDAAVVLFRMLMHAFTVSFAALIVAMLWPGPTSRDGFLLLLAAATNVGLWLGARRGFYNAAPFAHPLARGLAAGATLFFLQCFVGAAYFIPPLEDQDMELQGTAYGLMNELRPTMTTNDASQFYFSHPLLLHFWIGESALISGELEQLRYYHDGAMALGVPAKGQAFTAWEEASYAHWESDYAHFLREPVMVATRTPNMWLSALSLFPLGLLAYRMTGARSTALAAVALYVTLPEVYVRSAYGGYMAIANCLMLYGTYFYLSVSGLLPERELPLPPPEQAQRSVVSAAFLASWADQKNVILPVATLAHAGLRSLLSGHLTQLFQRLWVRPDVRAALLITLTFFCGWLSYIAYGCIVAPTEFIEHHIRGHVMERLAMTDVNLNTQATGEWTYPSIVALWQQFAEHSGWPVIALTLPALASALRRVKHAQGVLLLWIMLAGIGFSLIDWRQTKHLAQFLPALVILIAAFWSAQSGRWKWVYGGGIALAVLWNMPRVGLLMHDFEYIKPLPIW